MHATRTRVVKAASGVTAAQHALKAHWQPWQARVRRHQIALLIGAGLASGLALATLPPRIWSRLGALVFGGGARLARSAGMPVLLGTFWEQFYKRAVRTRDPTPTPQRASGVVHRTGNGQAP